MVFCNPFCYSLKVDQLLMLSRTAVLYFVRLMNWIFLCNFCLILRDIYYSDVPFFGNQGVVDSIVDNLACMLKVPRYCLHVVSFSQLKTLPHLYGTFFALNLSLFASTSYNNLLFKLWQLKTGPVRRVRKYLSSSSWVRTLASFENQFHVYRL